jgi:serine/threonine protein kinase
MDAPFPSFEAAQAWLRQCVDASVPAILRVTGDATAAVGRLLRDHSVRTEVRFQEPPAPDDVVWLHDGDAVCAMGDFLVAQLTLFQRPGVLVLTGPATDAGPRALSAHLALPGESSPTASGASHVLLYGIPVGARALEERILALEAEGDLLQAFGLWEVLAAQDPDRAARLRWVALQRLVRGGRSAEVLDRTLAGRDVRDDRDRLLLQVSEAAYNRGEMDRYHRLVTILAHNSGSRTAVDALVGRAVAEQQDPDPALLARQTPWRRQRVLALQARRGGPITPLEAEPGSPYRNAALALGTRREGRRDLEAMIALGHLDQAARIARTLRGTSKATRIYRDFQPTEILESCHLALVADDIALADRLLEAVPVDQRAAGTGWAQLLPLYGAVCAAHRDDMPAFLTAVVDVERSLDGRLHRHTLRGLVDVVLRLPLWPRTRLLALFHDLVDDDGLRARILEHMAEQPNRDLALDAYRLDHAIAAGGMGEVWRATHVSLDRTVAVKVIKPGATDAMLQDFRKEVDLTTRLEHPAIIAVLDHGTVPKAITVQSQGRLAAGQPYLVMEFAGAGSLEDRIGKLTWSEARTTLRSLLDALHYAHGRGLVHRDLKPGNVLFTDDGAIRLTDFGLSVFSADRVAGTPGYMAPEQFTGAPLDPRSDLYALGCLAWDMLTGRPPFHGTPGELRRAHTEQELPAFIARVAAPPGIRAWLGTMLSKRPQDRFPDARTALAAFDALGEPEVEVDGTPAVDGRSTLEVDTLLDLAVGRSMGTPVPSTIRPGSLPTDIHAISRQAVVRPRLPTAQMLDRGDPPYVGHDRQRQVLWNALLSVVDSGARMDLYLDGRIGVGKARLIRWLRNAARRQGLWPARRPGSDLAILEDAPTEGEGPWLVLHTRPPPSPCARIPIPPLDDETLFRVAVARIPISFALAVRAVRQANGRQDLLVATLAGWQAEPGYRPSPAGLELRHTPRHPTPHPVEWWRQAVERLPDGQTDALSIAALLAPGFVLRSWEQACEEASLVPGPAARQILLARGDGWELPTALREVLARRLGDRAFEVHHLLAGVDHTEPDGEERRWIHATRAGHPHGAAALAERVQQAFSTQGIAWPSLDAMETAQTAVDANLEPDPAIRRWIAIGRAHRAGEATLAEARTAARQVLASISRREDPLAHAAAIDNLLTLAGRDGQLGVDERVIMRAVARIPPAPAAVLRGKVANTWQLQGRVRDGIRLLERTLAQLDRDAPDSPARSLLLTYLARATVDDDPVHALALTEEALAARAPYERHAAITIDHTHIHLVMGEWDRALEASRDLAHAPLASGLLNRVIAHLHRDDPVAAEREAGRAIRDTLVFSPRTPVSPVLALGLAAHPAWPEEIWSAALANVGPQRDPLIRAAIRHAIRSWPRGSRRRALEERTSP